MGDFKIFQNKLYWAIKRVYCLKDVFFEQIYFLQYRKATLSQSEWNWYWNLHIHWIFLILSPDSRLLINSLFQYTSFVFLDRFTPLFTLWHTNCNLEFTYFYPCLVKSFSSFDLKMKSLCVFWISVFII